MISKEETKRDNRKDVPFLYEKLHKNVRYYLCNFFHAGRGRSGFSLCRKEKLRALPSCFGEEKRGARMDVNQKELAAILGISDRRVRQLKNEFGLFSRNTADGKKTKNYCLEKCVPEYINYKLEAEVQQGTNYNKEKEQAEHEQIKKKISILKLRRLKRELHEADDVEEFLTDMLVSFKNRLLAIPHKVAPLVVGEDDINIILDILEKEVFQTLEALSEYDPLKIDKDKTSQLLEGVEDEDEDENE